MSARYGLLHLLTLTERLLAPLLDAVRDEVRRPVPAIGFPIAPPCSPSSGTVTEIVMVPVARIRATPTPSVGCCFNTPGFRPADERNACNGSGCEAASTAVTVDPIPSVAGIPAAVAVPAESTGSKADVPPEVVAGIPATLTPAADPLFVRRDRGKLIRYVVAAPDEPGERYRRMVKHGRARYERAT